MVVKEVLLVGLVIGAGNLQPFELTQHRISHIDGTE